MRRRLASALLGTGLLVLSACSDSGDENTEPDGEPPVSAPDDSSDTTTTAVTTTTRPPATTVPRRTTTTTTRPKPPKQSTTTTTEPKPPKTTTTTTTQPKSTTTTTTTTTVPPLPGVKNPKCVVQIKSGDSLTAIADSIREDAVTVEGLQTENGITNPDAINAGDYLDVCVGNDVDDVSGGKHSAPPTIPANKPVEAQQNKLNQLFAPYGMPALTIDGDSGSYTEQQLCAARLALNMPASRADMEPGSDEERLLMAATGLAVPPTAPTSASRWALIDKTCQVMFVGEGGSLRFVFPTSTGESGYETRDQNAVRAFRFEPEADNGGWHNSYDYPTDNPLNGNMYMPIYFDGGQAIHGATNVPTYPASKGCSRLQVAHQDALIDWLGIRGITSSLWYGEDEINLTVTIQGSYY